MSRLYLNGCVVRFFGFGQNKVLVEIMSSYYQDPVVGFGTSESFLDTVVPNGGRDLSPSRWRSRRDDVKGTTSYPVSLLPSPPVLGWGPISSRNRCF